MTFELFAIAGSGKSTVARALHEGATEDLTSVVVSSRGTLFRAVTGAPATALRTAATGATLLPRWTRRRDLVSLLTGSLWQHAAANRAGTPHVVVEEGTLQRLLRLAVVDPGILDEDWEPLVVSPHAVVVLAAPPATIRSRLRQRGGNFGYAGALEEGELDGPAWQTATACFERIQAGLGSRRVLHVDAGASPDEVASSVRERILRLDRA